MAGQWLLTTVKAFVTAEKKSLVNSHHDPHFLDMDTVKNIISNADIWKNTKILFFKKNEIY